MSVSQRSAHTCTHRLSLCLSNTNSKPHTRLSCSSLDTVSRRSPLVSHLTPLTCQAGSQGQGEGQTRDAHTHTHSTRESLTFTEARIISPAHGIQNRVRRSIVLRASTSRALTTDPDPRPSPTTVTTNTDAHLSRPCAAPPLLALS